MNDEVVEVESARSALRLSTAFSIEAFYEHVDVLIIAVVLCARADFSSTRCLAHLARRRGVSSIALVAVILAVLRLDAHV